MKTNSYQREIVANYYAKLLWKYGKKLLIKHIPQIKKILWTEKGMELLEKKAGK